MKKIIAKLNDSELFHTVTAKGVKVLKQPADMDAAGKNMLKKYYGLSDFTVPKALSDPFENDHEGLMKKHANEAKTSKGKGRTAKQNAEGK